MEQERKQIQGTQGGKDLKPLNGKLQWLPVWNNHIISGQLEMTEVVKMPSPQLHEFGMNEKLSVHEGILLFQAKIISLVKFMGADWDKEMASEAAKIAYQEANWMTVAEVKYFINRVMSGKYPHPKNFSPATFMEFLNSYINETLATRGAVNSYAWRDNRVPDELFPLSKDPVTGEPGKAVDPDVMKKVLTNMTEHIRNMEQIIKEEEERNRKAKWQALKNQRDQQIIDLVERDATEGIAPDSNLMKLYFEARNRLGIQ